MKNFRTLELAIKFYELSLELEVKGHLRDQLLRAASSISLNLSECKTILRLANCQDQNMKDMAGKLSAWSYNLLKSEIPTLKF